MDADHSELRFFIRLVAAGSIVRTARELGLTGPAVSRRLARLEARLGVQLLSRTTRHMSLTPEGSHYAEEGRRILAELDALEAELMQGRAEPRGLLRVHAGFGFGRRQLAPAVSLFAQRYLAVDVQLHLSDQPIGAGDPGYDVAVRFGEPPDARVLAQRIAPNRRVLCAAPAYLARAGWPASPAELAGHQCIVLREGPGPFGSWTLCKGRTSEHVKVSGRLSVNNGEIAVEWALAGHGILLRSEWDVVADLRGGRLLRVLPAWHGEPADIYAIYPQRLQRSPKIRAFVAFLVEHFARFGLDSGVD